MLGRELEGDFGALLYNFVGGVDLCFDLASQGRECDFFVNSSNWGALSCNIRFCCNLNCERVSRFFIVLLPKTLDKNCGDLVVFDIGLADIFHH